MEDDKVAVNVNEISKVYKLYDKPMDRLKESFNPFRKKYHQEFYALQNISFAANKGDSIGIIGRNGSGKSTLLQIITGVLTPSNGVVKVKGNISALLELGAGFNPELTGLENVYFKSSLLGFSAQEIDKKMDDILDFANIGQFINQPVKTYSSGMFVRLAFAVAINVDPDVLIIDEALSVGDFRFQQKCLRKIRDFKKRNKTILFVSHSTHSVIEFCNKAVWLKDGCLADFGDSKSICQKYLAYMSDSDSQVINQESHDGNKPSPPSLHPISTNLDDNKIEWEKVSTKNSFGSGAAKIQYICLCLKDGGAKIKVFEGGERVILHLKIKFLKKITDPIIGFHLCDSRGVHVLGMNTITLGKKLVTFDAGAVVTISFEFDFPFLHIGEYSFSPAISAGTQQTNIKHHWVHDAYLIKIESADDAQKLGHYLVIKNDIEINYNILRQ